MSSYCLITFKNMAYLSFDTIIPAEILTSGAC